MSYYMGDYYQGDYYYGDPWNPFKAIGKLVKGGIKLAGRAAGAVLGATPVGMAIGAAGRILGAARGGTAPSAVQQAAIRGSYTPMTYTQRSIGPMGSIYRTERTEYGMQVKGVTADGTPILGRRSRRMNVTNVRALRRAIRRAKGFEKLAQRVGSFTRPGSRYRLKGRTRRKCA